MPLHQPTWLPRYHEFYLQQIRLNFTQTWKRFKWTFPRIWPDENTARALTSRSTTWHFEFFVDLPPWPRSSIWVNLTEISGGKRTSIFSMSYVKAKYNNNVCCVNLLSRDKAFGMHTKCKLLQQKAFTRAKTTAVVLSKWGDLGEVSALWTAGVCWTFWLIQSWKSVI